MQRISDVFTAYYPIYLISLCFGQAPYFIERKDKNNKHFKFSRQYFIFFSAIQTIVVIYINYMWMYWLETFTSMSLLYDVTQKLLHLTSSAAVTSQMLLGKLYVITFSNTFNELWKIEQVLKGKFQIEIPHKKIAFVSAIPLSICGILEMIGMTGAAIGFFVDGKYVLFTTAIVVTNALASLQIVHGQFLNGILIYRSLFSGIRCYLMEFLDTLSLHPTIHQADEMKCVEILRYLSKIHQELCENLREFNKVLSIQLLFSFTFHYVQICLYMFIWIIGFPSVGGENLIILVMMTFVYMAIVLKLLASIINAHLCINEVIFIPGAPLVSAEFSVKTTKDGDMRFSVIEKHHRGYSADILEIKSGFVLQAPRTATSSMNSSFEKFIQEMSKLMWSMYKMSTLKSFKVKKEANNFALQLFHEKIEITAAGFFDIDIRIIFSIVAAVTTHTIILIQFDSKVNVFESLREL